jgi:ABC-2 type transport system permease protein
LYGSKNRIDLLSPERMSETPVNNSNQKKKKYTLSLLALIVAILVVNIAAFRFHKQADLTRDSRFTITPATKALLANSPNYISVTVLLEGEDLPAGYKSLQAATEDVLRRFRDISGNRLDYHFVDPLGKDTALENLIATYRMSGFPVKIANGKKGMTEKLVFPWALVSAGGRSWPVLLQETSSPMINRHILAQSEMLLEYNLASAIHKLNKPAPDSIAYLIGNGQPAGYEMFSAANLLGTNYKFEVIELGEQTAIPTKYKAVIINRPLQPFSETDKFKIDQYLLQGGNIFLAVDGANGSLDSFMTGPQFNALPIDLNLNDMLFTYGARINHNLVSDAEKCEGVPMQATGGKGGTVHLPWVYYPILQTGSEHPIVKNMGEVLGKFVSSIDTVNQSEDITKTVLLTTSKYSRVEGAPMPVILAAAMTEPDRSQYKHPHQIIALMLEGKFTSLYAHRRPAEVSQLIDSLGAQPVTKAAKPGKIIMVGDGDILLNEVSEERGPMEMGTYKFSLNRYDNKIFMLNCMEHLVDPDNLLSARTKNFSTNILDPARVAAEQRMWQWVNIGGPVVLVVLAGAIFLFVRKRRYAA